MRGQGEDPKQLAEGMSLRKLCYEIEKLEQELEDAAAKELPPPEEEKKEPLKEQKKVRPFWSFLQGDSDEEDS